MLRICLQTLRSRRGSLTGAFVAILLAVGFMHATGRLMAGALEAPGPGRFAAADAVLRADPTVHFGVDDAEDVVPGPRVPAGLVAEAAAVPGARQAIGDISFPVGGVRVADDGDGLRGHNWQAAALTPYTLRAGRAPAGPDEVVVDTRVATTVGARVRVTAPGGAAPFDVVGIVRSAARRDGGQAAMFFTSGVARELSGAAGRVNAVGVLAEPGTSRQELSAALRDRLRASVEVVARAHAADADAGDPRASDRAALVAIFGTMGGIAAAVALFVVSGTFALAIAQRRRETAVLRALGASPRQVRRLIAGEALLVSLLAGALGLAAGGPLADLIVGALQARGTVPAGFEPSGSWIPAVAAGLLGVLIAQVAVVAAARRAGRTRPAEALREVTIDRGRPGIVTVVAGLVCLAGGAAMALTFAGLSARSFSVLTGIVLAMGVGLLGRLLLGLPAGIAARPLRRLGAAGLLASTSLAANRWRSAALATPIVLVAMLAGTQGVVQATDQREVERVTGARVVAGTAVTGRDGAPLPAGTLTAVAALRDVRDVSSVIDTQLYGLGHGLAEDSPWPSAGVAAPAAHGTLDLGVLEGNLGAVAGDRVAVSRVLARTGRLDLGDRFSVELADRARMTLTVVAIYDRAAGLGDVVLDPAVARRHAAVPSAATLFVDGGPGAGAALAQYAAAHPAVEVLDRSTYLASVKAADNDQAWAVWLIIALAAVFCALALVNTAAMATADRRMELATIRLLGGTRGHAMRFVVLEMLFTMAVALAVGGAIVAFALMGVSRGLTGEPVFAPLTLIGGVVGGTVALGLVAGAVTAAVAVRTTPAAAVRLRD